MTNGDVYLRPAFTRLYEWSYSEREEDVAFYVSLARECGSPVLEVACGTGRVLVPLAREGCEVVGIDFSGDMLAIAREKLQRRPPNVRSRVSLFQADMREFDLRRQFAAVFVPNASVFHLADRDALSQCFGCLYRHTRPGGMAVVDVVAPHRMAHQAVGVHTVVREGINPVTGLLTRELNQKLSIDRNAQIVRVEHVYVERDADDENCFTFEQDYRWLEEHEGVELLESAGFAEVDALGGYDGQPFDPQSERLILVARTAPAPL